MTLDRSALLALAARAEAGGDDSLSDDVWRAMGWVRLGTEPATGWAWLNPASNAIVFGFRPNLQTSLDAQAELPGRVAVVLWMPCLKPDTYRAETDGRRDLGTACVGEARTEPLARLAALLRAMAAAKEAGDGE